MGASFNRNGAGQPMQRPEGWHPQNFGDAMSMFASRQLGRPVGSYGQAMNAHAPQMQQPVMQQPFGAQPQQFMRPQPMQQPMQQTGGQPMVQQGRGLFGGRY